MSAKEDLVILIVAALPIAAKRSDPLSAHWEEDVAETAVEIAQQTYQRLHESMDEYKEKR